MDSVIGVLQEHALQFGTRTQFMVQEICEMRSNHWQPRSVVQSRSQNRNNGYNQHHNQHRNQHRGSRKMHRHGQYQRNKPRYNNHRGGNSYRSNKYNGQKKLNGKSVKFIEKTLNGDATVTDRTVLPQNMELTKAWKLQNT